LSAGRAGQGLLFNPFGPRAIDTNAAARIVSDVKDHWREGAGTDHDATFQMLRSRLLHNTSEAGQPGPDKRGLLHSGRAFGQQLVSRHAWGNTGLCPGRSPVRSVPSGSIYLNVSQFPVWVDGYFSWLNARPDVKPVFFLHDILPITYPEFFPAAEATRHTKCLEVIARRAAGLIVSSAQNKAEFAKYFRMIGGKLPPVCVNPLPTTDHFSSVDQDSQKTDQDLRDRPYFVCVGTIEPRKNHLLLLQIWREMAKRLGPATPALVLVGVRGWNNQNVTGMLARCPALQTTVLETATLATPALRRLLSASLGLLMPTFAEGYGLPVAEARAAGTPVIASDIEVFRDQQWSGATLIDPTDGVTWMSAILAKVAIGRTKNSQLPDISSYPKSWPLHLGHTDEFLASI
jgi:glycosyltransferase involved in cell wall biosynthesis